MRVAFYAPMKPPDHPVPSGDRRMSRLLMAALELGGHRVELASRFRAYDGIGDAPTQRALALQAHDEARQLLLRYRREGAPEAWITYHVYHKSPDWLGPAVACGLGIPYVVVEPAHAPKQAGGAWDVGYHDAAKAIGKADALLCMTRLDVAQVAPLAKPGARVEFLPPFLDAKPFVDAMEDRVRHRRELAQRHGLDPEGTWLLAIGMMRRRDKLDSYRLLGRALEGIPAQGWRLIVVGDGPERKAVEAALGPRAAYLGEQPPEAVAGICAAADLYVWPALGEAYGMALLEAQAAGLPVLAGNTRGVPDVVIDGETGVLVPPDDAACFADALADLLADPARRARMGVAARRHAASRDLPAAAARLDAMLRQVAR